MRDGSFSIFRYVGHETPTALAAALTVYLFASAILASRISLSPTCFTTSVPTLQAQLRVAFRGTYREPPVGWNPTVKVPGALASLSKSIAFLY